MYIYIYILCICVCVYVYIYTYIQSMAILRRAMSHLMLVVIMVRTHFSTCTAMYCLTLLPRNLGAREIWFPRQQRVPHKTGPCMFVETWIIQITIKRANVYIINMYAYVYMCVYIYITEIYATSKPNCQKKKSPCSSNLCPSLCSPTKGVSVKRPLSIKTSAKLLPGKFSRKWKST